MFNIGFGELAVICIVLIIAVGPERLPSMMKTLGKTIRTLRQASRDIRASTGIDEMMREDFDLYAPLKPAAPRRPAPLPAPQPEPAAIAADVPPVPTTPPSNVEDEPQPVSREDIVEGDRPSVVVAPAPQTVGLPPETIPEALPPEVITASPDSPPLAADAPPPTAAPATEKAIASNVDTLPRAPIIQGPTASAPKDTEDTAATPGEPKPRAAD